jgi:hypothetical protein
LLSYEVFELAMAEESDDVPRRWADKCKAAHPALLEQAATLLAKHSS